MITITVARKPLEGTVAANALKWGCGGLDIDSTRIGSDGGTRRDGRATEPTAAGWANMRGHGIATLNAGRWPANLILSHLPGCKEVGIRKVRSGVSGKGGGFRTSYVTGDVKDTEVSRRTWGSYNDPDGAETIPAWNCVAGCPVAGVDGQSGVTKSGTRQPTGRPIYPTNGTAMQWNSNNVMDTTARGFSDEGGASRFFKIVRNEV